MAFQYCFDYLFGCGISFDTFITDHHTSIAKHMREKLKHITHYFDLWHLRKSKLIFEFCMFHVNMQLFEIIWYYVTSRNLWNISTVPVALAFLSCSSQEPRICIQEPVEVWRRLGKGIGCYTHMFTDKTIPAETGLFPLVNKIVWRENKIIWEENKIICQNKIIKAVSDRNG